MNQIPRNYINTYGNMYNPNANEWQGRSYTGQYYNIAGRNLGLGAEQVENKNDIAGGIGRMLAQGTRAGSTTGGSGYKGNLAEGGEGSQGQVSDEEAKALGWSGVGILSPEASKYGGIGGANYGEIAKTGANAFATGSAWMHMQDEEEKKRQAQDALAAMQKQFDDDQEKQAGFDQQIATGIGRIAEAKQQKTLSIGDRIKRMQAFDEYFSAMMDKQKGRGA